MTARTVLRTGPSSRTGWSTGPTTRAAREDLLLAGLLASVGLVELAAGAVPEHGALATVSLLGMTAVLVLRRRHPLVVLLVVLGLFLVQSSFGVDTNAQLATLACALVAAYSVGAHATPRRSVAGLLMGLIGVLAIVAVDGGGASDRGFAALVVAGPWVAGLLVRRRAQAAADADAHAAVVEATAESHARRAAEDERARIARELHDVVSHGLSAMVVQATAAEELLDRDPERARDAIRQVQDSGREAMVEMRHLLGVLRPAGGPGRDPQPTLDDLTDLVLAERRAGRSVTLDITSDQRDLPRGLALSAYRIVQEALTNVRRHAGEASVVVRVLVTATALEIEVADDGMVQSLEGHDPGYGLAGMRERARLYGGRIDAGPRNDPPGWRVHATFPLEPATGPA